MGFHDHFSGHAPDYMAFRPTYPPELFAYLASLVTGHELAWDCATGNGQAAIGLAPHFRAIVATDASAEQIAQARPDDAIRYIIARSEQTDLPAATVDLVVVAQALHWLDLPRFYEEVRRVGRPGSVLACWCYCLHSIDPDIDMTIHRLYADVVGPCWPPERRIVEEGYATIEFPFVELSPPPFRMIQRWDLPRLMSYLGTWSSVQRYRAEHGEDPLDQIREELSAAWGDPGREREIVWPLHLRVGRVNTGD